MVDNYQELRTRRLADRQKSKKKKKEKIRYVVLIISIATTISISSLFVCDTNTVREKWEKWARNDILSRFKVQSNAFLSDRFLYRQSVNMFIYFSSMRLNKYIISFTSVHIGAHEILAAKRSIYVSRFLRLLRIKIEWEYFQ